MLDVTRFCFEYSFRALFAGFRWFGVIKYLHISSNDLCIVALLPWCCVSLNLLKKKSKSKIVQNIEEFTGRDLSPRCIERFIEKFQKFCQQSFIKLMLVLFYFWCKNLRSTFLCATNWNWILRTFLIFFASKC